MAVDPITGLPVISLRACVRRLKGVSDSEDVSGAVEKLSDELSSVRLIQIGSDTCITWDDYLAFIERRMAEG